MSKTIASNNKLHVKSGDRVMVVAGKDKGKIGSIKKAFPKIGKVIVEGLNMITKAVKPNPSAGIQGGLIKMEAPLNSAKVMIFCAKCEKPTRIRHEILEGGKKVRVCKKCGEQLD